MYNLIRPGDNVRSSTLRKVTTETQTGSKNSQRVHITLTILVETITYDPSVCILHLKGQNIQENEHVRLGAYHTLDIEINRQFTLTKECWDSIDLFRLNAATDPAHSADVAAVIMHEGLANICLLTSTMTIVKSKIDMQVRDNPPHYLYSQKFRSPAKEKALVHSTRKAWSASFK
jgi:protein pelota